MTERIASSPVAARDKVLQGRGLLMRMRRFLTDRRGVGAIEFAIVAPLMIMAYIGAFEISVAVSMSRKVSRASSTVSDLLTRSKTTSATTLAAMTDVTKNIVAPFSQDGHTLKITGIAVNAAGQATIAWSHGAGADAAYAKGAAVTLPKDMTATSTFLVRTEYAVPHTILLMAPGLSADLRKFDLKRTSFFRQREGDGITCSGC
ncbi:MAG: TadE/TadG family type IV pilus assembly protein [Shinella sp.]|uniref:TadE/TadG family type IV pilus assembly protein n=1 Tax=Shinella sp. TaxID=1870904 RepID=UPI003C749155